MYLQEDESENAVKITTTLEPSHPPAPVVKAKASVLMNSLIISKRNEQYSLQKFTIWCQMVDI